ncbi:carbohydrate ABC transporter permease [Microbacterium azadirachtae]|uniref:Lactose transport system permease protein LacG n=1 Tax=Microbacterium azadirachtae TaxID=582680 RepID=A0A0F0KDC3_9MICO|nr:carbohydrate ABC transporter permease [Microbacterium azadirachtae]KJL18907.1 Lactose transport system permease protein LacG [Microbacterium azadirachtae]UXW87547.1 carbohydrate ABC transporter permease [Microbacterium azadirachtae]SDL25740.1 cellobiose ABC transporter membrane protein [Microbacterium azadirachtae]SEF55643.1 cellobiose ABC transporter membrane protein [Microbacterium azadirachtae]SEF55984.1 cellobiose ABC transporter membrane protein [Microbacterium azadirachtae]
MSSSFIENTAGRSAARYAKRRAARGRPIAAHGASRRPGWFTYGALTVVFVLSIFPLYAAAMYGSSTTTEITRSVGSLPRWLPTLRLLANFGTIFSSDQFSVWLAFANSLLVALTVSVSVVFFSTLAGFSFSKLRFRGRRGLYVAVIATMVIPAQVGTIPLFVMMNDFGWMDSVAALIVPGLVGAFGVFWMTQYLEEALPYELVEAARVDGASMIRTFWSIALPAARPAAATLALFTFIGSWNSFFWPSVVLRSQLTMPLVVPQLKGVYTSDTGLVMAGVFLVASPLLIVLIAAGKQLVSGVMAGAVKG